MMKVVGMENMEGIYHFTIEFDEKMENYHTFHNEMIVFLYYLKFPDDEIIKVDKPFSEVSYIYVHHPPFKIHFFGGDKCIDMVFDTSFPQEELYKIMKEFFIFPKQ